MIKLEIGNKNSWSVVAKLFAEKDLDLLLKSILNDAKNPKYSYKDGYTYIDYGSSTLLRYKGD